MSNQNRNPAGTPTGGQFSAGDHAEADIEPLAEPFSEPDEVIKVKRLPWKIGTVDDTSGSISAEELEAVASGLDNDGLGDVVIDTDATDAFDDDAGWKTGWVNEENSSEAKPRRSLYEDLADIEDDERLASGPATTPTLETPAVGTVRVSVPYPEDPDEPYFDVGHELTDPHYVDVPVPYPEDPDEPYFDAGHKLTAPKYGSMAPNPRQQQPTAGSGRLRSAGRRFSRFLARMFESYLSS